MGTLQKTGKNNQQSIITLPIGFIKQNKLTKGASFITRVIKDPLGPSIQLIFTKKDLSKLNGLSEAEILSLAKELLVNSATKTGSGRLQRTGKNGQQSIITLPISFVKKYKLVKGTSFISRELKDPLGPSIKITFTPKGSIEKGLKEMNSDDILALAKDLLSQVGTTRAPTSKKRGGKK